MHPLQALEAIRDHLKHLAASVAAVVSHPFMPREGADAMTALQAIVQHHTELLAEQHAFRERQRQLVAVVIERLEPGVRKTGDARLIAMLDRVKADPDLLPSPEDMHAACDLIGMPAPCECGHADAAPTPAVSAEQARAVDDTASS